MKEQMNAVIWDGGEYPNGLSYGAFDKPELPGGHWVQIYNHACGICGSDIHALTGRTRRLMPDRNFPAVLGHENAGVVTAVGNSVSHLKAGDRVAVEPLHGCIDFGGSCMKCRLGLFQLCERGLNVIGMPNKDMMPGGYGEFSCVHQSHVFKIPDGLSFAEAAVTDVLAVGVHAMNIGDPQIGMKVVVLGAGAIGLDMLQVLKSRGISDVLVVARHAFQAEAAMRLGAARAVLAETDVGKAVADFTHSRGADQAYECVGGNAGTLALAIDICAIGGKIVIVGCPTRPANVDIQAVLFKEAALLPSNSYSLFKGVSEFAAALSLLETGQVNHKALITESYDPQDYGRALDSIINKQKNRTIKPVFERI